MPNNAFNCALCYNKAKTTMRQHLEELIYSAKGKNQIQVAPIIQDIGHLRTLHHTLHERDYLNETVLFNAFRSYSASVSSGTKAVFVYVLRKSIEHGVNIHEENTNKKRIQNLVNGSNIPEIDKLEINRIIESANTMRAVMIIEKASHSHQRDLAAIYRQSLSLLDDNVIDPSCKLYRYKQEAVKHLANQDNHSLKSLFSPRNKFANAIYDMVAKLDMTLPNAFEQCNYLEQICNRGRAL